MSTSIESTSASIEASKTGSLRSWIKKLNCSPSDVSESLQQNCRQPEPCYSRVWEFYVLYLKRELQMKRNPMFTPLQWVLATILPWQRRKKKASLSCHWLYSPSFFLYVPVCRSVFAKIFLKLTTTTKHANDWYAQTGFPYGWRLCLCPDTHRTDTFRVWALNHRI